MDSFCCFGFVTNQFLESSMSPNSADNSSFTHWPMRLTVGWILFAAYFLIVPSIVATSRSTGRFDDIVALEQLPWLLPFVVMIPWLSISTFGISNRRFVTTSSVLLLLSFLLYSIWLWLQWGQL
jgi:hypothetical protein